MRKYRFSWNAPAPRVLCISYRGVAPVISRCLRYEFEDLVGAIDAADVVAPEQTLIRSPRLQRLAVKLEGLAPVTGRRRLPSGLARDYDLLFVSVQTIADLYTLAPWSMWRSAARVSACYVEELYASDVASMGSVLKVLSQFDHLFVGDRGTAEPLSRATKRPCHYLPPSTDALKFCPYPEAPQRVVDFYAMGRRPPETHRALMRMAEAGDWYYMYDTVGNGPVSCHTEHRRRLADLIKRSRFFLVNPAMCNNPDRTGGQQELGFRYFEGAAGGAVLIGDAPRNATFNEFFGWSDSVIPLPYDSPDIGDVIAELDADPVRVERISKTNVVNSLRRHDHVYRWAQVLAAAGLPESEAMRCRRVQLAELAAQVERSIPQATLAVNGHAFNGVGSNGHAVNGHASNGHAHIDPPPASSYAAAPSEATVLTK